jgi:hypothetical protein
MQSLGITKKKLLYSLTDLYNDINSKENKLNKNNKIALIKPNKQNKGNSQLYLRNDPKNI